MPPPVTPSPFRFVGTAGPPSKESTTAGGQYQIPRPTSQDQFARTPRFSFASIRKTELKTLPPAQASSPLSSKARKRSAKIKQLDDVEDSASEGGRENFSNDRGQQEQILLPGEVAEEYEITAEEKPAPRKRTKFSGPLALFSKTTDDPSPTIASPQLALFAARSKEPIYISSSGSSTHGSDGEDKTPQNKSIQSASRTKNRPKSNNAAPHTRFLLPIHTPTKPNKFSHHHLLWSPQRNSRSPRLPHLSFTPHGLAQTMREFIMQTSLAPSYDTTFPSMSEISRPPPESLSFSVSAARLDRSMVTIFAKDMTNDQTLCIVLAGQGQAENGTSRNGEEMKFPYPISELNPANELGIIEEVKVRTDGLIGQLKRAKAPNSPTHMLFTFRVRAHPGTWGFAAVTADEALLTFGETNQRIAWVVRPGNYPVLETRVSDLSQAVSSLLVPITLLTLAEFNSLGATAASVYADSSPGNAGGWAERWFGMFIQRIIPDSSMTSFPAVAGDIIAPIDITMGLNDIMSGISQQLALQKDTDTKAYVLYNILTSKDPEEWGFAIIPVRKTLSLEETKVQPVLELRPKSFPMVPVQKTLLSQLTRQADYRLVAVKVLTQTEWALLDFLVANALTKAGPMDQPGWAARWYSSFLTEVNAKPIRSSNRPMKRALSDKSIIPYPKIALATQAEIILDVKSEMDGVSEQLQASDGKPVLDPRRLVLFAYLAIEKPNEEWGFALVPAGPNLNARATAEQIIKVMGPENREARVGDTALAELAARTNSLLIPVKVLSSEESVSYAQWLQRTITAAGRQDATWASRWYTAVLRELRVPLFPLAADHHASLLPRASPQPPYPQPRPSKSPKPQKTTSAAFATERRRAGAAAADDGLLARAARGTAR